MSLKDKWQFETLSYAWPPSRFLDLNSHPFLVVTFSAGPQNAVYRQCLAFAAMDSFLSVFSATTVGARSNAWPFCKSHKCIWELTQESIASSIRGAPLVQAIQFRSAIWADRTSRQEFLLLDSGPYHLFKTKEDVAHHWP